MAGLCWWPTLSHRAFIWVLWSLPQKQVHPSVFPRLPAPQGQKSGEVFWVSSKRYPRRADPGALQIYFLMAEPSLLLAWLRFTFVCTQPGREERRLLCCRGDFTGAPYCSPCFCFAIPVNNPAGAHEQRGAAGPGMALNCQSLAPAPAGGWQGLSPLQLQHSFLLL